MNPTTNKQYTANFQQYRNDLFWDFCTPDTYEILKWSGYDDQNWWDNVCTRQGWGERVDSLNRVWKLDPVSDEVTLVSPQS